MEKTISFQMKLDERTFVRKKSTNEQEPCWYRRQKTMSTNKMIIECQIMLMLKKWIWTKLMMYVIVKVMTKSQIIFMLIENKKWIWIILMMKIQIMLVLTEQKKQISSMFVMYVVVKKWKINLGTPDAKKRLKNKNTREELGWRKIGLEGLDG